MSQVNPELLPAFSLPNQFDQLVQYSQNRPYPQALIALPLLERQGLSAIEDKYSLPKLEIE